MTATVHAVLGTIIAAKVGNPTIAIPLAIISHIVTDAIPHWDAATNKNGKNDHQMFFGSIIDVGLGFVLSYSLLFLLFPKTNLTYALILIIASQSLDWVTAPYYFFGVEKPPFIWFYQFQKIFHKSLDNLWGIITQVGVVLAVLIVALLI